MTQLSLENKKGIFFNEVETIEEAVKKCDKENDNDNPFNLLLYSSKNHGEKSHGITVEIRHRRIDDLGEPVLLIDLNRNEAKYIANYLLAFIDEKEIDINAED